MRQGRTDYRLQRRALLQRVREGQRFRDEVCDAHPELLRAAQHLGTRVSDACPICERQELVHVHYVFEGKTPRTRGGRAVPREALARQAERYGDLTVYTVEVCTSCGWHHLLESYLLLARDTAVG
jgi:hypothetical protein